MLSCGWVSVLRPYSSRLLTTPSDLAPMSTRISSLSMRTTVPSTTSPCFRLRISPDCSLRSSSIVVGSGRSDDRAPAPRRRPPRVRRRNPLRSVRVQALHPPAVRPPARGRPPGPPGPPGSVGSGAGASAGVVDASALASVVSSCWSVNGIVSSGWLAPAPDTTAPGTRPGGWLVVDVVRVVVGSTDSSRAGRARPLPACRQGREMVPRGPGAPQCADAGAARPRHPRRRIPCGARRATDRRARACRSRWSCAAPPGELAALEGQAPRSVTQRGKFLVFQLERDRVVINPMLTGRLGLATPGAKAFASTAFVLRLGARATAPEDAARWTRRAPRGCPGGRRDVELRYRDPTRMGKVYVLPGGRRAAGRRLGRAGPGRR